MLNLVTRRMSDVVSTVFISGSNKLHCILDSCLRG